MEEGKGREKSILNLHQEKEAQGSPCSVVRTAQFSLLRMQVQFPGGEL